MMLSNTEIIEKINTDEDSGVEFKTVEVRGCKIKSPERDDLSDEIAAFANQEGGIILFGVEDKTRQIVGVHDSGVKPLNDLVSEVCRDSIKPPVVDFFISNTQISDETGSQRTVAYLQIRKSLWLHKSSGGYYYRHGTSKRIMSTEHILRIAQSRSQARIVPFDEQLVPNTDPNTLQKSLYQKFIPEEPDNDIQWLAKRHLLLKENGNYRATVAGILMCSESPDDYLPNALIRAVCYNGEEKDANYQIDAKDCKGTLDNQIIDAFKFVKTYNKVSALKDVGRTDNPQYSMKAVFEALVNAVIHRDYSIRGSAIRLFIFSNRLELHSPGKLANTLTVDELPYNQVTRNELVARLLSESELENNMSGGAIARKRFLERRGEGVGIILRESEQLSGKKPVYEMIGEELKLTVFAANHYSSEPS